MQENDREIEDSGFQAIMDKCYEVYEEENGKFFGVRILF